MEDPKSKRTKLTFVVIMIISTAQCNQIIHGDVVDTSSAVQFTMIPEKPILGLTQSLDMRCAVNPLQETTKGATLLAMQVMKADEVIASLTPRLGAQVWSDKDTLSVTGTFGTHPKDQMGFLNLTWTRPPTDDQAGEYRCLVQLFHSQDGLVSLSREINLTIDNPDMSVDTIVGVFKKELERMNSKMEGKVREIKEEIVSEVKASMETVKSEVQELLDDVQVDNETMAALQAGMSKMKSELQSDIEQMRTQVQKNLAEMVKDETHTTLQKMKSEHQADIQRVQNELNAKLAASERRLKSELRPKFSRIETGLGKCSGGEQWISFSRSYSRAPAVFVGTRALDFSKHTNVRWLLWVAQTKSNGFKVLCKTFADTIMYPTSFNWISIEQ